MRALAEAGAIDRGGAAEMAEAHGERDVDDRGGAGDDRGEAEGNGHDR